MFGCIREYMLHAPAHETLFFFAPYIQAEVLAKLLEGIRNKIAIVTTWEPRDILFGSSDLEVYRYCRERGVALYVSDRLHLKVYSAGLVSAIVATGNISRRGLMNGGNYEVAVELKRLASKDRLFLESIRANARLVDDSMYVELKAWLERHAIEQVSIPALKDLVSAPNKDDFLLSALPMTRSVKMLDAGYARLCAGADPSDDPNVSACIVHDLANYSIPMGLSGNQFRQELSSKFFAHPFIRKIDDFMAPEAYFGRIKAWVQKNCTDVPVPSRRELTGNVQVLLEWFVELGDGRYVVDVPGARSERITRI